MSTSFRTSESLVSRSSETFDDVDFVPQAILRVGISYFSVERGFDVQRSADDLDEYEGVAFFDEALGKPVALRHYAGHPQDTVTIYLPYEVEDVGVITKTVHRLIDTFGLNDGDIVWERKDNPEL